MSFRANISKIVAFATLVAALALPAQALAEYYVPPGNSAANQYTESLPSAGGESAGKGSGGGGSTSPEKSLGARNAHRLEAQGPAGKAAAEVAAETAPPASLVVAADRLSHSRGGGHQSQGNQGNKGGGGGGASQAGTAHVSQPSGSSGLGEIVAQATGSSDDGNLGLWLPLVILATLAGSIAYVMRHRSGPTA